MTIQQFILYLLAPLAGYFLGSIPFALLIGKANGVDIRTIGSKNIGATNLGRALGPKFFFYAFLLDAAKGFIPVLLVSLYIRQGSFPSWSPLLTAVACVLGHTYPLWLKFKGGKGVATSFGVLLGFWPLYTLAAIGSGLVFLLTLLIYRYISLASIVGSLSLVAFVTILGTQSHWFTFTPWRDLWPLLAIAALFAFLIILRHRANIARLLKGTEPKIRSRRSES
jgi:acyl phosphate:glycerol-3-phosphate acyltransferase